MSFPLQPYYANANQLRQGAAVLVVPTQLTRARTSLPGSLNHSAYSVTNIIIFLVIIVLLCYYHCMILSFIIAVSQKKLGFVKNLSNYTVTNTNSSESNIHLQQSILSSDFNTFLVVSTNKAIKMFWLWLLLRKCFQLSPGHFAPEFFLLAFEFLLLVLLQKWDCFLLRFLRFIPSFNTCPWCRIKCTFFYFNQPFLCKI